MLGEAAQSSHGEDTFSLRPPAAQPRGREPLPSLAQAPITLEHRTQGKRRGGRAPGLRAVRCSGGYRKPGGLSTT